MYSIFTQVVNAKYYAGFSKSLQRTVADTTRIRFLQQERGNDIYHNCKEQ